MSGIYETRLRHAAETAQKFIARCRAERLTVNDTVARRIYVAFEVYFISVSRDLFKLWQTLSEVDVGDVQFDDLLPFSDPACRIEIQRAPAAATKVLTLPRNGALVSVIGAGYR
jgi:hypothetical protein